MILNAIASVFNRIGEWSKAIARRLSKKYAQRGLPPPQSQAMTDWFACEGDRTHRMDYDELGPSSIIFDLGGFHGQWASDIFAKYQSKVFVFEPYLEFARLIESRFAPNDKITLFPFGLGKENQDLKISISGDGTSLFGTEENEGDESVKIVEISEFLLKEGIDNIDLMKINIEGAEYDLLEHMIEHGIHHKVKNLQIQFHDDYVENPRERMIKIQESLAKSHETTYSFEFVWENWKRKE